MSLIFSSRPPVLGRTGLDQVKPFVNHLAVHSVFSLTERTFARVAASNTRSAACTTRPAAHRGRLWPHRVLELNLNILLRNKSTHERDTTPAYIVSASCKSPAITLQGGTTSPVEPGWLVITVYMRK